MAGVLSRCATRLTAATATARPTSLFLTLTRRPSAITGPHAAFPRFQHTQVQLSPEVKAEIARSVKEAVVHGKAATPAPPVELTPEVKAEIARIVQEAVKAESLGIRTACLERYQTVSLKQTELADLSATRHAESLGESVETKKRVGQIAFRVCLSMVGFAAASQYKAELTNFFNGGGPPSDEEVEEMVNEKVQKMVDSVVRDDIGHEVRTVCAKHFLEQQRVKDLQKKD